VDLLTRIVSYAIIVGAAVVKLPQIFNVLKASSAKGLNINSIYIETVATLAGTAYNILIGNPFRTYGETALILLQNIFIVMLVWSYTSPRPSQGNVVAIATIFLGLAAMLFNVAVLEPVWPVSLASAEITPLFCVYSLMTALYVFGRVSRAAATAAPGTRCAVV
jgi:uncharacterized protein with PQ loop repeat